MWFFGKPNINKMFHNRNVRGLIKVLSREKYAFNWNEAAEYLGILGDHRAVTPLLNALKSCRADINKKIIIDALKETANNPHAVKSLVAFIKDGSNRIDRRDREEVEEILSTIDAPDAVTILIDSTKDDHPGVRKNAIKALGKIGNDVAVEPLITALEDEDKHVRSMTAYALGEIGTPEAFDCLLQKLNYKDEDHTVLGMAIEALSKIGDSRAVKPLLQYFDYEASFLTDILFRRYLVEALEKLGWEPDSSKAGAWFWIINNDLEKAVERGKSAVFPLLQKIKQSTRFDREAYYTALIGLLNKEESAFSAILEALENEDSELCCVALEVLRDYSDSRAVEYIQNKLNDNNSKVRRLAIQALAKNSDQGAMNTYISKLNDQDSEVRSAAVEVLGNYKDVQVLEALMESANDDHYKVRVNIVNALLKIGDQRAIIPLRELLKDDNTIVRINASKALVDLKWKPEQDEYGLWFWVIIGDIEKAKGFGANAVEPLLAGLNNFNSKEVRRKAAIALIEMYHEGNLDDTLKSRILASRIIITKSHEDRYCFDNIHSDRGIGINFPL